jgi:CheY-like chemotaxis protein
MASTGPIVYVEDDEDDISIFTQVLADLGISNELICFTNTKDTLDYLLTTTELVFLIFCDINLPGKNGLELKMLIDFTPELRKKSIPFIFFSTTASDADVELAYTKMTVQGFFKKPVDYQEMRNILRFISEYWFSCKHPNIL